MNLQMTSAEFLALYDKLQDSYHDEFTEVLVKRMKAQIVVALDLLSEQAVVTNTKDIDKMHVWYVQQQAKLDELNAKDRAAQAQRDALMHEAHGVYEEPCQDGCFCDKCFYEEWPPQVLDGEAPPEDCLFS